MKKRKTTEDYLKTIYRLSGKGEVRGVDIAKELQVTKPTVCVSLKELERLPLYDAGTDCYINGHRQKDCERCYGEKYSFRRLLLSLGVDKETAANDACEMEHAVSPESFEALKQMIGKDAECERIG